MLVSGEYLKMVAWAAPFSPPVIHMRACQSSHHLTEHIGSVGQSDHPQVPVLLGQRTDEGPGVGTCHEDLSRAEVFLTSSVLSSSNEVDLRVVRRLSSALSLTCVPELSVYWLQPCFLRPVMRLGRSSTQPVRLYLETFSWEVSVLPPVRIT